MRPTYEAILMGGSWGGMNALTQLLQGLPGRYSIPIVVVLHRGKHYASELENLIGKKTDIRVKEAEEKEKLQPGHVYLAPANYHLLIESEGSFSLDLSGPVHYSRPSIDVTFESAAAVYKNRLAAFLLTGANRDGAQGLKVIAEKGGMTVVQDPEEAESAIMPRSALEVSSVHSVLTLSQIRIFLLGLHAQGQ